MLNNCQLSGRPRKLSSKEIWVSLDLIVSKGSYRRKELLKMGRIQTGEGNGTPLQYSCWENPMEGGAWEAAVHEVAKSWT